MPFGKFIESKQIRLWLILLTKPLPKQTVLFSAKILNLFNLFYFTSPGFKQIRNQQNK